MKLRSPYTSHESLSHEWYPMKLHAAPLVYAMLLLYTRRTKQDTDHPFLQHDYFNNNNSTRKVIGTLGVNLGF